MTALPSISLSGEYQHPRYIKVALSGAPFAFSGLTKGYHPAVGADLRLHAAAQGDAPHAKARQKAVRARRWLSLNVPTCRVTLKAARGTALVRVWLLTVAALVFLLVSVGGATRLTGSGLSITEWKPIVGIVPPLSAADWQDAFDKYRQIPQYQQVNKGMSLGAFKRIFWWEWTHRFLGRAGRLRLSRAIPRAAGAPAGFRARCCRGWSVSSRSAGCRVSSAGTW